MSDDKPRDTSAPRADDETQPVRAEGSTPAAPSPAAHEASAPAADAPAGADAAAAAAAEPTVQRRGFRERLRSVRRSEGGRTFGLAALVASALAGIIVGGLGAAAVGAITDDHERDRWSGRDGWVQRDDDRGPGDRGGMRGGPRGVPGQLPPTTAPEDDEGSTS
jgi:hypothetical protein